MNIENIDPVKVSRKYYLEPLAKRLKLNPKIYKNRTKLYNAIVEQMKKPSLRCENMCDPITLTPLDEIPDEYLFEWDQNSKHYAADVRSLKAMIQKDQTILPWAIDNDTGISQSKNADLYLQKYDLKNVEGLIDRIQNHNVDTAYDFEYEDVPDSVKYRFQIEYSTSEYVSHTIDYIEMLINYKIFYYEALMYVCNQYNGEMYEGNGLSLNNVIKLELLSQIAHTVLHDNTAKSSLELLVICINTIKHYFEDNAQNIIDLLFMTFNEFKNEADN